MKKFFMYENIEKDIAENGEFEESRCIQNENLSLEDEEKTETIDEMFLEEVFVSDDLEKDLYKPNSIKERINNAIKKSEAYNNNIDKKNYDENIKRDELFEMDLERKILNSEN